MLTPYAGIGSRKTPTEILQLMHVLGAKLHDDGYVLRTGHATGADQAFELGAKDRAEIFLPWESYNEEQGIEGKLWHNPTGLAMDIAREYHPAWDKCSPGAQLLHARNSHIVLGNECNDPVSLVIAWYDPNVNSGTMQAIRIAEHLDIEIRNLFFVKTALAAAEYCEFDKEKVLY